MKREWNDEFSIVHLQSQYCFFSTFYCKLRLISALDNLLRTLAHENTLKNSLMSRENNLPPGIKYAHTDPPTYRANGSSPPPGIHLLIPLPSWGKEFDNQSLPGGGEFDLTFSCMS